MKATVATFLYRASIAAAHALFLAAMRVDRVAVTRALGNDSADQMDDVVQALVDLGEARRLAGLDK